jgi:ABC-2 type transport system permease protein
VNAQHLWAFLWLRWRLRVNQLRRGGAANAIIVVLLSVGVVILAFGLFAGSFLIGLFALRDASPVVLLYVWDGLVGSFLFFGAIALVTDLQRSESLSLDKFLHLPVSLSGAFLVNYLSSLVSLNMILFLPAMIGLCLALILVKGPAMVLLLPLLAAFVLMISALTYQFQGWLASLMVNKRRRRTIIVMVTAGFVLISQLPNLINYFQPWNAKNLTEQAAQQMEEETELHKEFADGRITAEEFQQKIELIRNQHQAQKKQANLETLSQIERTARLVNLVFPPGWLPLGAMSLAETHVSYAMLGTLGMSLIGAASLWRAYRTTQRLYTGQYTSGKRKKVVSQTPAKTDTTKPILLDGNLPWISQQAAVITLGSLRSLLRAPEAKMMLLSPVILVAVFGAMFFRQSRDFAEAVRPLIAFGAVSMILLTMVQLVGNQFGFDRNGFRVFVLCPAPRKDILLGKNLAFAPFALGLGLLAVAFVQIVYPMRVDHLLALLPQMVSMYLLYSLLANCLSILAPMPIAAGSLKPANARLVPVLMQFAFVLLLPTVLAPTLVPLGFEQLLVWQGWIEKAPVALVLSIAECAVVVWIYYLLIGFQGDWLQAREKAILAIVATKAE